MQSGPESQKLGGLLGDWNSEGASIDSPFGPAETQSLTVNCEWFAGHFAVVRRLDGTKSLSGEDHELQVLTCDRMASRILFALVQQLRGLRRLASINFG